MFEYFVFVWLTLLYICYSRFDVITVFIRVKMFANYHYIDSTFTRIHVFNFKSATKAVFTVIYQQSYFLQLPPLYLLFKWTNVQLCQNLLTGERLFPCFETLIWGQQLNTLKGILKSDLNVKHIPARTSGVIFRILLHLEPILEQLGVNLPCSGDTMADEVQEIWALWLAGEFFFFWMTQLKVLPTAPKL